jgi:uncharacterized protein YbbK (DUF523 family)
MKSPDTKKKAIVSACILGEFCRYDGKTKEISEVIEALREYDIIAFCPEAPLFGTPRQRINVVEIEGENRIITDVTQEDVTALLETEINAFLALNPQVDRIILKSKSPSCGYKTTPILNQNREVIKLGSGIAAKILEKYFEDIIVEDEISYLSLRDV